jgi:hypothetical protein
VGSAGSKKKPATASSVIKGVEDAAGPLSDMVSGVEGVVNSAKTFEAISQQADQLTAMADNTMKAVSSAFQTVMTAGRARRGHRPASKSGKAFRSQWRAFSRQTTTSSRKPAVVEPSKQLSRN